VYCLHSQRFVSENLWHAIKLWLGVTQLDLDLIKLNYAENISDADRWYDSVETLSYDIAHVVRKRNLERDIVHCFMRVSACCTVQFLFSRVQGRRQSHVTCRAIIPPSRASTACASSSGISSTSSSSFFEFAVCLSISEIPWEGIYASANNVSRRRSAMTYGFFSKHTRSHRVWRVWQSAIQSGIQIDRAYLG